MTKYIILLKLSIVKFVCWLFLPKDVWVGNYWGIYTTRHVVLFGRTDDRGVLQGITQQSIIDGE